jgi:hypothetical protein
MSRSQAKNEMKVFTAFAETVRLPIVLGSIQKRDPPEPDLSCEMMHAGQLAFELVEVIDSGFATSVNEQIRIEQSLRRAVAEDLSASLECFSDALIFIRFRSNAGLLGREKSIPALFEFLRELPVSFVGDVVIPSKTKLHKWVKALRVTRGEFPPGPHFQVEAGRWLADPIIECLTSKFGKRYKTECPIELLVYYDFHPAALAESRIPAVRGFVNANIGSSPFRRVWVYAAETRAVLYDSAP